MTKSLRQIINDYELGEPTIYKNEHFYIELSKSGDNIEFYFENGDNVFSGRFKNKLELLETTFNEKLIFYDYLDELLSNDDV